MAMERNSSLSRKKLMSVVNDKCKKTAV